jgi:hypothetical protein
MQTFTDNKGRKWEVTISVGTVKKAKAHLDVDMMNPKAIITRIADPIFLCDLLFVVCKEQADKEGITDEDFGYSMGGHALWDAQNAFTEEYIDFFQNPEVRENLRALTEKLKTATTKMQQTLSKRIEKLDGEIERTMTEFEKELENTGTGSINWQELQE